MFSVLVISPDPSVPGGVSAFISSMKRHLARSVAEPLYVGSSGYGSENPLSVVWRLVAAPFSLIRRVGRKKYDVVHLNPSFDIKSLIRDGLLLLALRAAGFRRILVYFHGWDCGMQEAIIKNSLLRRPIAWMLNKAALIAVLGNAFRDGLIKIGVDPERIVVTRTMFDGAIFKSSGDIVPATRRTILFMSRFDREKGGRELIEAFAKLAGDYSDLDLVMAGDGEDRDAMRQSVAAYGLQSRIFLPGYVGGSDKGRLLKSCAIFALPTYYRSEGMPVVVLEAMGAGKPLLVGAAGVLSTIIHDPDHGVLLPQVTAQTVEAGLRRLLSDADLATIGQHNAAEAWDKYEARIVTAEIEALYQQVSAC